MQKRIKIGSIILFQIIESINGKTRAIIEDIIPENSIEPTIEVKKQKSSKYFFKDKNEAQLAFNFLSEELLKIQKRQIPAEIREQIEDLWDLIDDLLNGGTPNIETIEITELYHSPIEVDDSIIINRTDKNYWQKTFNINLFFDELEIIGTSIEEEKTKTNVQLHWGAWRNEVLQIFNQGYSDNYFNHSYIEKGAAEQVSVYNSPPPIVELDLIPIQQKDFTFYISKARVCEIAQSSSVPAIPPIIGIRETAFRIINKNRNDSEWQREMDRNRIQKISNFISEPDNIIANAPMLYVRDDNSIHIKDNKLIIDFGKFLKLQKYGKYIGKYVDREKQELLDSYGNDKYTDFRPFWIIDGQHRVRGMQLDELGQDIIIPLIIFPKDFNISNTAKIFAEINTLQKKLDPLHELYMQHRFCIDHVNSKRKFRDYKSITIQDANNNGWALDWEHSRANTLSYNLAAMLSNSGVLENRIKFLPQNTESPQNILVSADQWVNYSRTIFFDKSYKFNNFDIQSYFAVSKGNCQYDEEIDLFYDEIYDYFSAIRDVCNSGWIDKKDRWSSNHLNKGLLQTKSHFILLLETYPLVIKKCKEYMISNNIPGRITTTVFKQILSPLGSVDWISDELSKLYGGGGEKGRRSLEVWIRDAIINGITYPTNIVMSNTIHSQAGQGILSRLSTPIIENTQFNNWPKLNDTWSLLSRRPTNARYEAEWKLEDTTNNQVLISRKNQTSREILGGISEFKIYFDSKIINKIKNSSKLKITVTWKNAYSAVNSIDYLIHK